MARSSGGWTVLVTVLALAQFTSLPFAAADGGGAGPRLKLPEIRYDPNAGDADEAANPPLGFTGSIIDPIASKYSFGLSLSARANEDDDKPPAPVELRGLYTKYSADFSLGARIRYRFPSFNDTEAKDSGGTAAGGYGYSPSHWVNEEVTEALSTEERMRQNLEKLTPEEGVAVFFGVSVEDARAWIEWMKQGGARDAAREWLGDEGYEKIQAQFGRGATAAAARDASEWKETYLYCGGACVAAGY